MKILQSQRMYFGNLCFLVIVFPLLSSLVEGGDYVRCRENERRALMEFKAGVVDDGILSSWGNSSNEEECCNWKGIRCSNSTGRVIVLNLPGNRILDSSLTGKISPSLSELKHLKYLNLTRNFFDGEIPPQLGNLTNLRSLDLSGNEFGGKIPHQLGNLTNLLSLDLGYNQFNGEIPPHLGNLTNLRYLDMGRNYNMKARNLDWVSNLNLLTHLDLSGDNLSSCDDWLNRVHKLSSLTHLLLSSCRLPDPLLPLNNTSYSALNSLAVIDLSGNDFTSPQYYNWLSNFTTTLVYLDLSGTSLSRIPEAFGRIICDAPKFPIHISDLETWKHHGVPRYTSGPECV